MFRLKVDGDNGADRAWTFSENDDAVSYTDGFRQVVSDQKSRNFLFPDDIYDIAGYVQAGLVVKGAERFVKKKKGRVPCQGADERRPLAHAAGELMGMGVGEVGDVVLLHECADIGDIFFRELMLNFQSQDNVFVDCSIF